MSNYSAEAEAWLKAKAANRKIFTRREINWIDDIAAGKTDTKSAAEALGVSRNTINTWLRLFGYRRRATYTRAHRLSMIPWNSPLRCSECGILLQYAESQVDGLCDWCVERRERMSGKAQVDLQQAINEMESALAAHEDAVMVIGRDNA